VGPGVGKDASAAPKLTQQRRIDDPKLLPDLDRESIKALNHDAQMLQAVRPDVLPEIERVLAVCVGQISGVGCPASQSCTPAIACLGPSPWPAPAGRACWPGRSRSVVDSGAPPRRRWSD
jgi:hypothetical protein